MVTGQQFVRKLNRWTVTILCEEYQEFSTHVKWLKRRQKKQTLPKNRKEKGMSENEAKGGENTEQETPPANEANQETDFAPISSQEELNRIIGERIARERKKYADYEDLKQKAAKFDEVEESQKTELQKAQERLAKAEAKAAQAEIKALRADVATATGVPAKLLAGTTKEELEASAKALLEFKNSGEKPHGVHNRIFGQPPSNNPNDAKGVVRNLFAS